MVLLETKTGSVKDGITELYKNTQINKIKKRNKPSHQSKFK
jgi:hypothetical protein